MTPPSGAGRVSEWPHDPQPVLGHRTASCRHPSRVVAKECLAALPARCPQLTVEALAQHHMQTEHDRRAGRRPQQSRPSLGRPQHRSSSTLRACGRSVLTPPHGRGMPTAADQLKTQHSKGVDGPAPFRKPLPPVRTVPSARVARSSSVASQSCHRGRQGSAVTRTPWPGRGHTAGGLPRLTCRASCR